MNEERLQKIKDSLNAQYEIARSDNKYQSVYLVLDEEQELVEEIERLNNIINSIDTRLIEMGVDDVILDVCEMYDVNGIELRKMIKKLKGVDKE